MQSNGLSHARPEIKITSWDLGRLQHVLSFHATKWSWRAVEFLVRKLMRAHIVNDNDVPDDTVTMRSRLMFREDNCGVDQVVTLTYPGDREFYDDALSVLTPVGAALIGLSEGQSVTFPAPDGRHTTLTVLKILSQPERTRRTERDGTDTPHRLNTERDEVTVA